MQVVKESEHHSLKVLATSCAKPSTLWGAPMPCQPVWPTPFCSISSSSDQSADRKPEGHRAGRGVAFLVWNRCQVVPKMHLRRNYQSTSSTESCGNSLPVTRLASSKAAPKTDESSRKRLGPSSTRSSAGPGPDWSDRGIIIKAESTKPWKNNNTILLTHILLANTHFTANVAMLVWPLSGCVFDQHQIKDRLFQSELSTGSWLTLSLSKVHILCLPQWFHRDADVTDLGGSSWPLGSPRWGEALTACPGDSWSPRRKAAAWPDVPAPHSGGPGGVWTDWSSGVGASRFKKMHKMRGCHLQPVIYSTFYFKNPDYYYHL